MRRIVGSSLRASIGHCMEGKVLPSTKAITMETITKQLDLQCQVLQLQVEVPHRELSTRSVGAISHRLPSVNRQATSIPRSIISKDRQQGLLRSLSSSALGRTAILLQLRTSRTSVFSITTPSSLVGLQQLLQGSPLGNKQRHQPPRPQQELRLLVPVP